MMIYQPTRASASSQPAVATASPEMDTLHVIFHGTFLFNFASNYKENDESWIEVLAPVVDNHVFRIGNWFGEVDLGGSHGTPRRLKLSGAKGGDAQVDPTQNMYFTNQRLKCEDVLNSLLTARILMPRPKLFTSPRRAEVFTTDFDNPELLPKQLKEMSTLQIMTFDVPSANDLKIESQSDDLSKSAAAAGHQHGQPVLWEPGFSGKTINLHIYSAPEQDLPAAHVISAFDRVVALFENLEKLKMKACPAFSTLHLGEIKDQTPGVSPEETEDLAPRRRRLSQFGRMRKEGRDLNLLWFETEAFDDCPDACASFCLS